MRVEVCYIKMSFSDWAIKDNKFIILLQKYCKLISNLAMLDSVYIKQLFYFSSFILKTAN